jgi:hypothetical protein
MILIFKLIVAAMVPTFEKAGTPNASHGPEMFIIRMFENCATFIQLLITETESNNKSKRKVNPVSILLLRLIVSVRKMKSYMGEDHKFYKF